jgi:hypothetical protein
MNQWIIWIIAGVFLLAPWVISAKTIRNLLISLRLPISWISALPYQGWGEVRGSIRGNTVRNPIDQSDCAFYQLEVKEYRSHGKGGSWRTIYKEMSAPFEIDDMTGRIKVQKSNAQVVVRNDLRLKVDSARRMTLENLGINTKGLFGFDKRLRVYLRLIAPGEEILVVGKIVNLAGGISISGKETVPIIISDLTRSELLKRLAWQAVKPMIITYLVGLIIMAIFLWNFVR